MKNPIKIVLRGDTRKVEFSMNPEEIACEFGPRVTTLGLLEKDVDIRRGRNPHRYTWSGILPGRERRRKPYVFEGRWAPPLRVKGILQDWADSGREVRLTISYLGIADRVYVSSFTARHSGGAGDITYDLDLIEARRVSIEKKRKKKKNRGKGSNNDGGDGGGSKDKDRGRRRYRVKSGDTLFKIAKRFLGSGNRWREIYNVPSNKKKIGPNPNVLKVGTELIIPKE